MKDSSAWFGEIVRAGDVHEGDYVLGAIHGPSWPLEALRVTRACWNGHSRSERRIETHFRYRVVGKDVLLFVMRSGEHV